MNYPTSEERAVHEIFHQQQAQRNLYVKSNPLFVSYPLRSMPSPCLNMDTVPTSYSYRTYVPIALLNLSSNNPTYDWSILAAIEPYAAPYLIHNSWGGDILKDVSSLTTPLYGTVRVLSTRTAKPDCTDKILAKDHTPIKDVGESGLPRCNFYGIKLSNIKEHYLLGKPVLTNMQRGEIKTCNSVAALNYIEGLSDLLNDNLQTILASIVLGELTIKSSGTLQRIPDWFNYRDVPLDYNNIQRTKESGLENILNELVHIFSIFELATTNKMGLGTLGLGVIPPPQQHLTFTSDSMYQYFMPEILGETFVHYKSKAKYKIIGFAFDGATSAANKAKLKVIYYNVDTLNIYVRDASDWVRSFSDYI